MSEPIVVAPSDRTRFRTVPWSARRDGVVDTFDDATGLGVLATDDGAVGFHCTAIADGSRHIDSGTVVSFAPRPGLRGQLEASDIRPSGDRSGR